NGKMRFKLNLPMDFSVQQIQDAPSSLLCSGGAQIKVHLKKLPKNVVPIEKAAEVLQLVR
ncbi:MAG: hypothetical protein ACKO6J_01050, partial [Crocinitomicaceae bacterium]